MDKKINLFDVFCKTVEQQPERIAIQGPNDDQSYTYKQLQEFIEDTAENLKQAGLQPGMTLGLHYGSGVEYIALTYATWCCGACVAPIAVELMPPEKERIFKEIGLDLLVTEERYLDAFKDFICASPRGTLWNKTSITTLKNPRKHPAEFKHINGAFLRFTSGTTGTSKGVILSHQTIYERIHAANECLHIGTDDNIIWLLSMSYHFTVSIVAYLSFGASIVLCKNFFGSTIVQTATQHNATIIYGSPIHYQLMSSVKSDATLPTLRLAISTTTALSQKIARAFYERFNLQLSEAYGIIEIGLPFINLHNTLGKSGSVGKLLPAYEIKLDETAAGDDLKEIKLRGKGIIDAYYDPWTKREDILNDGWFLTGDLGRIDEDGYLFIVGRSKEIINVGGMKCFPQEIEAVLVRYPGIKEAVVHAKSHGRFGEVPSAQVVLKPGHSEEITEDMLKEFCTQNLEILKIPEHIEFVDKLERTASGKLIRKKATDTEKG